MQRSLHFMVQQEPQQVNRLKKQEVGLLIHILLTLQEQPEQQEEPEAQQEQQQARQVHMKTCHRTSLNIAGKE
jgi:hypothetical protein